MKILKLLILLCALNANVFASLDVNINERKRYTVNISRDQFNRISAIEDRVQQVFGNEGEFLLSLDEKNGQIFIKPSQPKSLKNIHITIVTEGGKSQDLKLIPLEIEPKTLRLLPIKKIKNAKQAFVSGAQKKLLKAMMANKTLKGFKRHNKIVTLKSRKELNVKRIATYSGRALLGEKIQVKNTSKRKIKLSEKDFQSNRCVLLKLSKHVLLPGHTCNLWVIKRNA